MTEADIRKAWRRHTASGAANGQLAEALEGLHDGASASARERSAALLGEDARAADLGRALYAINADARQLEAEHLALRTPRRALGPRRVLAAMAAMLALAAVIALPQWRAGSAPQMAEPSADSLVASSSFESVDPPADAGDSATLFRSSFDS